MLVEFLVGRLRGDFLGDDEVMRLTAASEERIFGAPMGTAIGVSVAPEGFGLSRRIYPLGGRGKMG